MPTIPDANDENARRDRVHEALRHRVLVRMVIRFADVDASDRATDRAFKVRVLPLRVAKNAAQVAT